MDENFDKQHKISTVIAQRQDLLRHNNNAWRNGQLTNLWAWFHLTSRHERASAKKVFSVWLGHGFILDNLCLILTERSDDSEITGV